MYKRLSALEKKKIVKQYLSGKKASKLCREAGISRTVFYAWVRKYKESRQIESKVRKGAKHWRKIDSSKERRVIRYSLTHPQARISDMSKFSQISTGSVWKILLRHGLSTVSDRKRYRKKNGLRLRKKISLRDKERVVKRVENGEKITHISKSESVSRTIIYSWFKRYASHGQSILSLKAKHAQRENHWRYRRGSEEVVLEIVKVYPEYTLDQIVSTLTTYTETIRMSRSGVYYLLKRYNLTTMRGRLLYAKMHARSSTQIYQLSELDIPSPIGYTNHSSLSPPEYTSDKRSLRKETSHTRERNLFPSQHTIIQISMAIIVTLTSITFSLQAGYGNVMLPRVFSFLDQDIITIFSRRYNDFSRENIQHISADPAFEMPSYAKVFADRNKTITTVGAIAINTTKNSYTPGEMVDLGIGIIDKSGVTVCDADIVVRVYEADNHTPLQHLSSREGTIASSPECRNGNVTYQSDYSGALTVSDPGNYQVNVEAHTTAGRIMAQDNLVIREPDGFIVQREKYPSRIYPKASYPVSIRVKAERDFIGEVIETLPNEFAISDISESGDLLAGGNGQQQIQWNVNWKKGGSYHLTYEIAFPLRSPAFYINPSLQLRSKDRQVFSENRYWEIVADSLE